LVYGIPSAAGGGVWPKIQAGEIKKHISLLSGTEPQSRKQNAYSGNDSFFPVGSNKNRNIILKGDAKWVIR